MSIANLIREYVNSHYFEPARQQGQNEISIISGRIHNEMELSNSYPLVCSTLRGKKIETYGVTLIQEIRDPTVQLNSSTNKFIFQIRESILPQNSVIHNYSSSSQTQEFSNGYLDSSQFEERCRSYFSKLFNTQLNRAAIPGVPKVFDFVSSDNKIVGDAKFYTMVHGEGNPSAKLSTISEYVWLLEKIPANYKFLVFGNDIRVPEAWLKKNGDQIKDIDFFFYDPKLDNIRKITNNPSTPIESSLIKFNSIEEKDKSQNKSESDSKWDPILNKFSSGKSNLVKVDVNRRDADYIYNGLRDRIDYRKLSTKIDVSVVNDICYLEKIDCRQILEENLIKTLNWEYWPLLAIFYQNEKLIHPSSAMVGFLCEQLYYEYADRFDIFDEDKGLIYIDFIKEKMPIIKYEVDKYENDPKVKKEIKEFLLNFQFEDSLKSLRTTLENLRKFDDYAHGS